jgi:Flp pilus assembly protein TadD
MGDTAKAVAESRRALDLEPDSPVIGVGVGWCLYHSRMFEAAVAQYRKALKLAPDFALAHGVLGMALERTRDYEGAIAEFNQALDLQGSVPFSLGGLGSAHALAGRRDEARRILRRMEELGKTQYVPAIYTAAVYAALGERERFLDQVRKAVDERSDYVIYLRTEPWADPLRSDPEFQKLLQTVSAKGF